MSVVGDSWKINSDAAEGAPPPAEPNDAAGGLSWPSSAVAGWLVAGIATLYFAHWARPLLVPLVLSILVALTLAPAVRLLCSWHLPRTLAALLVVAASITAFAGATALLSEPAAQWMERAPRAVKRLERELRDIREPIEAASAATDKLINGNARSTPAPSPLAAGTSNALATAIEETPSTIGALVATVFLVFLMLAHGERMLRKCVTLMPSLSAKKDLVSVTRDAQYELSRYLLTISLINIALGAATAAALHLIGIKDAILFGCVAALLNFAPYVGAVVTAALLLLAGFAEQSTLSGAIVAPGLFVALNIIEGQVVTPLLVGHRLELDPVLILLSLLVLGWLWGVAGLLIAVPLLAGMRVVAQRIDRSGRWAILLGDIRHEARLVAARAG